MTPVAILLLAAGASSRMQGRDKLLEKIDGAALLARQTARALATGCPVWVTLPSLDHPRASLISSATPVAVPNAQHGMGASLRTGVSAIPEDHAILILPADMPDITTNDIQMISSALHDDPHPSLYQGCTTDNKPGHPVLFPPDCRAALLKSTGDTGARHVVDANRDRLKFVTLPGTHAITDLDTPAAWAAYLANRSPDS